MHAYVVNFYGDITNNWNLFNSINLRMKLSELLNCQKLFHNKSLNIVWTKFQMYV